MDARKYIDEIFSTEILFDITWMVLGSFMYMVMATTPSYGYQILGYGETYVLAMLGFVAANLATFSLIINTTRTFKGYYKTYKAKTV